MLKVDAEGMETEILDCADQTIRVGRPIVFIEFIKVDREALKERLTGYGYEVRVASGNHLAYSTEFVARLPAVPTSLHGLIWMDLA
jgi:hypothetical protein